MAKSNRRKNGNGNARRNGGGRNRNNRTKIAYILSNMGRVWDTNLSTENLRKMLDKARMHLPPVNFNGPIDSDTEIMVARMVSEGMPPNDALEVIELIEGSGRMFSYLELPDFDPSGENAQEKKNAAAQGMASQYASLVKLRSSMVKAQQGERKKIKDFRTW